MGYSIFKFLTGHRRDAHEIQNGSLELEKRFGILHGVRPKGVHARRAFARGLSPIFRWWGDEPLYYGIPQQVISLFRSKTTIAFFGRKV
jgi:hypothetical protein